MFGLFLPTCHRWPPWSWAAARWTAPHWSGGWWAAACWAGSRWKTGWSPAATHWSQRCGPACWGRCHERLRSCSRRPPDELCKQSVVSPSVPAPPCHHQWVFKSLRTLTVASLLHKPELAGSPVSRQSDYVEVLSSCGEDREQKESLQKNQMNALLVQIIETKTQSG